MIGAADVLAATRWSQTGFPHDRKGLLAARRAFHPDINRDPLAGDAFAALQGLYDLPDYPTRLAAGMRVGDHRIAWTLDAGNVDLVDPALRVLHATGSERWTPAIHGGDSDTPTFDYGDGWWFLNEFEALDGRTAVWVFRRLLAAIAVTAATGFHHPSIDASHVLLHPDEHGLMLDGWWGAVPDRGTLGVLPDVRTPVRYINGAPVDENMNVAQAANLVLGRFDLDADIRAFLVDTSVHPGDARTTFEKFAGPVSKTYGASSFHPLAHPSSPCV